MLTLVWIKPLTQKAEKDTQPTLRLPITDPCLRMYLSGIYMNDHDIPRPSVCPAVPPQATHTWGPLG